MKRFRRWLFNGMAGLTLLIFIALCVQWPRSYWRADTFAFINPDQSIYSVTSQPGKIVFATREIHRIYFNSTSGWRHFSGPATPGTRLPFGWVKIAFAGFYFSDMGGTPSYPEGTYTWKDRYFAVPYWFGALVTGMPSLFWLKSRLRIHRAGYRRAHNLCDACGYDLRATPDRCPECGTTPAIK